MAKKRTLKKFYGKAHRRAEEQAVQATQRGDIELAGQIHSMIAADINSKREREERRLT